MPEIRIKSCGKTSNYNSLEAVARWMKANYSERNYMQSRNVTNDDKQVFCVKELPKKDGDSICDCSFEVTKIVI